QGGALGCFERVDVLASPHAFALLRRFGGGVYSEYVASVCCRGATTMVCASLGSASLSVSLVMYVGPPSTLTSNSLFHTARTVPSTLRRQVTSIMRATSLVRRPHRPVPRRPAGQGSHLESPRGRGSTQGRPPHRPAPSQSAGCVASRA